jgi:hypothetical protein
MNEFWAADPLSDGSIVAVEAIEKAITVDLIATFEPQLKCCATTDTIVSLLADSNYAPYDYLPVRSSDRIVGLLQLDQYRDASKNVAGLVAEGAMSPLDQSILITSSSSVLRYIEEAEASRCRLVLRHTQIDGIVTISDLQKLAVRPALFTLVTHLELLMAAAIRARFQDRPDDDWLTLRGQMAGTQSRRLGDRSHRGDAIRRQTENPRQVGADPLRPVPSETGIPLDRGAAKRFGPCQ